MTTTATTTQDVQTSAAAKSTFEFWDLKAQFATIRQEVMAAITRVMESQHFILGPEVKQLEDEIASKFGAKYAIGCASGTDALILSLMAAEIGPGDEVITTPFSFVATAGSIAHVGTKPAFVDIDPVTYNINPALIEAAITPKTRAIMPVHLFGFPADLDPVLEIARAHGLVVIEDAAQAVGARYNNHFVGTLGDFGCFSFFPSKNLGGAGDGGLITTNHPAMADRLRLLRVHGSRKKYRHDLLGTNSRLDALQAAILRVMTYPQAPPAAIHHVYNQFTIRCTLRDELREFLQEIGVPSEIYYPLCLHLQPAFSYLGYMTGQFPDAEMASKEVLSLPVYPELSDAQQTIVVNAIAEFCAGKNAV
jgi:dTDP-4-amino-4,6-dideoxygalactose transaminase